VNFQLEARDSDVIAGDILEFYLIPNGGLLPPGLSLSKTGLISGFTDPVFAVEYTRETSGGYDTAPLDVFPIDFVEARSNGFDTFLYDAVTFDYNEPSRTPRRLSRIYNFVVAITDGVYTENRLFKIYVVTEEFLQADNSIVQVDTNLFQADASSARNPIWITGSDLGRFRANNYVTIFLDVYDPPTLSGTITYFLLPTNPDNSVSELPPGMALDSVTGEIAGSVPYQARISRTYTFTIRAVNYPVTLAYSNYVYKGTNMLGTTASFANITNNLPAMPVYDGLIALSSSNLMFLATDLGVYASDDGGATWSAQTNATNKFPKVATLSIRQYTFPGRNRGSIYAGTHGRGFFECQQYFTNVNDVQNTKSSNALKLYPNPSDDVVNVSIDIKGNVEDVTVKVLDFTGKKKLGNCETPTHYSCRPGPSCGSSRT
jgi:hypothetical protein